MKPTKEYIENAHAKGCYVDRSDGTIYPAVPRFTFMNAIHELTISYSVRLYHCKAEICLCNYSGFFKCCPILLRSYSTFVAVYIPPHRPSICIRLLQPHHFTAHCKV